jgi:hypothetical protein
MPPFNDARFVRIYAAGNKYRPIRAGVAQPASRTIDSVTAVPRTLFFIILPSSDSVLLPQALTNDVHLRATPPRWSERQDMGRLLVQQGMCAGIQTPLAQPGRLASLGGEEQQRYAATDTWACFLRSLQTALIDQRNNHENIQTRSAVGGTLFWHGDRSQCRQHVGG